MELDWRNGVNLHLDKHISDSRIVDSRMLLDMTFPDSNEQCD